MFGYYLDDLEPELRFVVSSEGIRRETDIRTYMKVNRNIIFCVGVERWALIVDL
jgi:hypothetical protein